MSDEIHDTGEMTLAELARQAARTGLTPSEIVAPLLRAVVIE